LFSFEHDILKYFENICWQCLHREHLLNWHTLTSDENSQIIVLVQPIKSKVKQKVVRVDIKPQTKVSFFVTKSVSFTS
jgi:hypothetical protein